MIILIEGADGSGKSTLVNQLNVRGYFTFSIDDKSKPSEEYRWKAIIASCEDNVAICDRCSFISDLVYRICDGKPRRGIDLYKIASIMRNDVAIVHCKTDSAFEDAMLRGEDNIVNSDSHNELEKCYDMILEMFRIFSGTDIFEYNWKKQNVSDVINFIEGRKLYAVR